MTPTRGMAGILERRAAVWAALRTSLRKTAHACYVFAPLPVKWKNRCAHLLYGATGWIFSGDRNYELWRRGGQVRTLEIRGTPVEDQELRGPVAIRFAAVTEPMVSVIIAATGNRHQTLRCLRSLHKNLPRASIEVIVTECGSGDSCGAGIEGVEGVRFVAGSRNAAARQARGQYLHFLDHDTEVTEGWLDRMLDLFRAEDCGLVGSMLVFPDGRLEQAGGIVWRDGTISGFGRLASPGQSAFNYVREVDCSSSASVLIATALFHSLRGFDAQQASGAWADADLAFRVRAAGKRVLYQPRSVVIHHRDIPGDRHATSETSAECAAHRKDFLARWQDMLLAEHLDPRPDGRRSHDRPAGRKTILVVDDSIPQPDRDAGSRSMWCILRVLAGMGLAVKFLPQDGIYDPEYAAWLEQAGIEVVAGDGRGEAFSDWLAAHGQSLDFALLSRPTVAPDFLPSLRRSSPARILFYGHDLHYARLLNEYELTRSMTARRHAESIRATEQALWREADVVYYPSCTETEVVRRAVPGVQAHTMPLYFFDDAPQEAGPEERTGILFVAGFGHPPNVDAAKWLVRAILPLVRAGSPTRPHLWLVGSNPTPEIEQLAAEDITVTGYVPDERLLEFYRTARVAIVPLRIGAGMKGKVIEALHHGVPLVTTPVGAQGLENLEAVIPVSNDEKTLARHVCDLLRDDAYWTDVSRREREYMQGRFSLQAMEQALQLGMAAEGTQ